MSALSREAPTRPAPLTGEPRPGDRLCNYCNLVSALHFTRMPSSEASQEVNSCLLDGRLGTLHFGLMLMGFPVHSLGKGSSFAVIDSVGRSVALVLNEVTESVLHWV